MELRKTIDDVREFIPFNLRGNFDKNSKNLTIEYIESDEITASFDELVEYDFDSNTIYLNKKLIENINDNSLKNDMLTHSLIKGFLLMASTNYKKNKAINIGFGSIQRFGLFKECSSVSNIGLTAGYTELKACEIEGKDIEYLKSQPLAINMLFSKQVEMIVGKDLMYDVFFKYNNGQLEKALSKIDSEISILDLLENMTNVLYLKLQGYECNDEIFDIQTKLKILFSKSKNCGCENSFLDYTVDGLYGKSK